MARVITNEHLVTNLRKNVKDIAIITDEVVTQVGQLHFLSWKYPDKWAVDLNVDQLLREFTFDFKDVNQSLFSQFALLELIVDRMVLFIQGANRFLESEITSKLKNLLQSTGNTSTSSSTSISNYFDADNQNQSITSALRQMWQNLNQTSEGLSVLTTHILTSIRSKESIEYYNDFKDDDDYFLSRDISEDVIIPTVQDSLEVVRKRRSLRQGIISDGSSSREKEKDNVVWSRPQYDMFGTVTYDASTLLKSTSQDLIDTFQIVGDKVMNMLQDHSLPCSLDKSRLQVMTDFGSVSANHVTEWCQELMKELNKINKYVIYLEEYLQISPKENKDRLLNLKMTQESPELKKKLQAQQEKIQALIKEITELRANVDLTTNREQHYIKLNTDLQRTNINMESNVRVLESNLKQEKKIAQELREELMDKVATVNNINVELGRLLEENQRLRTRRTTGSSGSRAFRQ